MFHGAFPRRRYIELTSSTFDDNREPNWSISQWDFTLPNTNRQVVQVTKHRTSEEIAEKY